MSRRGPNCTLISRRANARAATTARTKYAKRQYTATLQSLLHQGSTSNVFSQPQCRYIASATLTHSLLGRIQKTYCHTRGVNFRSYRSHAVSQQIIVSTMAPSSDDQVLLSRP